MSEWEEELLKKIWGEVESLCDIDCGSMDCQGEYCSTSLGLLDLIKQEIKQYAEKVKPLPCVIYGEYACDKVLREQYGINT